MVDTSATERSRIDEEARLHYHEMNYTTRRLIAISLMNNQSWHLQHTPSAFIFLTEDYHYP